MMAMKTLYGYHSAKTSKFKNTHGNGRIDVLLPKDKEFDICIWAKGYEPLMIRKVKAPLNLGEVKLSSENHELEEITHTVK